jgi:hypothetical protein
VLGFFKMKFLLIGLLLASPAIAAWTLRGAEKSDPVAIRQRAFDPKIQSARPSEALRVPVEVIEKGSAAQWIYIETGQQAVPEPGIFSLLAVASLALVLRRQRS